MPVTSVRENENNRWKTEGNKQRQKEKKEVAQTIVKVWELNYFVETNWYVKFL